MLSLSHIKTRRFEFHRFSIRPKRSSGPRLMMGPDSPFSVSDTKGKKKIKSEDRSPRLGGLGYEIVPWRTPAIVHFPLLQFRQFTIPSKTLTAFKVVVWALLSSLSPVPYYIARCNPILKATVPNFSTVGIKQQPMALGSDLWIKLERPRQCPCTTTTKYPKKHPLVSVGITVFLEMIVVWATSKLPLAMPCWENRFVVWSWWVSSCPIGFSCY